MFQIPNEIQGAILDLAEAARASKQLLEQFGPQIRFAHQLAAEQTTDRLVEEAIRTILAEIFDAGLKAHDQAVFKGATTDEADREANEAIAHELFNKFTDRHRFRMGNEQLQLWSEFLDWAADGRSVHRLPHMHNLLKLGIRELAEERVMVRASR